MALAVQEDAAHGHQRQAHQGDDPERDAEVVRQQVAHRAGDVRVLHLLQPVMHADCRAQQRHQCVAQQGDANEQPRATQRRFTALDQQGVAGLQGQDAADDRVDRDHQFGVDWAVPVPAVHQGHGAGAGRHRPVRRSQAEEAEHAEQQDGFAGQLGGVAQHIEERAAAGHEPHEQQDAEDQGPGTGHPESRTGIRSREVPEAGAGDCAGEHQVEPEQHGGEVEGFHRGPPGPAFRRLDSGIAR
ncbi:hypothetical protein D9M70_513910 [compost metagenome]